FYQRHADSLPLRALLCSNAAAAPATSTLSLHDALPISRRRYADGDLSGAWYVLAATDDPETNAAVSAEADSQQVFCVRADDGTQDRKSTRLNSSHVKISYAVFCLKKKNRQTAEACDDDQ